MADLHQLHHCQDQQFPFMKYVNSFLQYIWNYSTNYDKTVYSIYSAKKLDISILYIVQGNECMGVPSKV